MGEVFLLGLLLGGGAALSVGPIFVTILQESATRGFGAGLRVILGSATADLVLLLPALAFAWLISAIAEAGMWVGLIGTAFFLHLAVTATRDARRLWRGEQTSAASGWAFWKGLVANLANPLSWTFWLATGTPTMLRVQHLAGWPGLVLFTITWFLVASGMEALIALVVAKSGRRIGARGQALFTFASAVLFLGLAGTLLGRDVIPQLVTG